MKTLSAGVIHAQMAGLRLETCNSTSSSRSMHPDMPCGSLLGFWPQVCCPHLASSSSSPTADAPILYPCASYYWPFFCCSLPAFIVPASSCLTKGCCARKSQQSKGLHINQPPGMFLDGLNTLSKATARTLVRNPRLPEPHWIHPGPEPDLPLHARSAFTRLLLDVNAHKAVPPHIVSDSSGLWIIAS